MRHLLLAATIGLLANGSCASLIIYDQSELEQIAATSIGQPRSLRGEAYDDFILNAPSVVTGLRIWTLERGERLGPFEYFIHEDLAGLPKLTPLTSGQAQSLVSAATGLPAQVPSLGNEFVNTFQLETPIFLEANTRYWLGFTQRSVNGSNPPRWEMSNSRVGATMQRALSLPTGLPLPFAWQTLPNRDGAFQIHGTVIPEPSACMTWLVLGLTIGGGGVLGLAARRTKR